MKHPPNHIGKYRCTCRQPVECVINHILTRVSITPMEAERCMIMHTIKNIDHSEQMGNRLMRHLMRAGLVLTG